MARTIREDLDVVRGKIERRTLYSAPSVNLSISCCESLRRVLDDPMVQARIRAISEAREEA